MAGKRIIINGSPVDYTCENTRFKTDIISPVSSTYPGSVSKNSLYDDGNGNVLLLEKVIDKTNNNKCFWFMWYMNGIPMLTMSGVIDEADIAEVVRNISKISF